MSNEERFNEERSLATATGRERLAVTHVMRQYERTWSRLNDAEKQARVLAWPKVLAQTLRGGEDCGPSRASWLAAQDMERGGRGR